MSDELRTFLINLDWPSSTTVSRMESQLYAERRRPALSGQRSSRLRTGVSRSMSVGSTPRAMYLRSANDSSIADIQRLSESVGRTIFADCIRDNRYHLVRGDERIAAHNGFEEAAINSGSFDAVEVSGSAASGERRFQIEWVESGSIPSPSWTSETENDPAWAMWLLDHPSGEYIFQAHAMLLASAQSSLFAQHALMSLSECDGEYRFTPSPEAP